MYRVTIRFYEELNDFLPESMRRRDSQHTFYGRRSVKDLIESFGVPHTEVDLILVNGTSVRFTYLVQDGDRISVYPVFESLDINDVSLLRPRPLRVNRFTCDVHLPKLARILGLDTLFDPGATRDQLVAQSEAGQRILLTRDRGLLMRSDVTRGIVLRRTDPVEQVREVLDRLDLRDACAPFSRCTLCNEPVETIHTSSEAFAEIRDSVPPGVLAWCTEYTRCTACGHLYWKGSHYAKLAGLVGSLLEG